MESQLERVKKWMEIGGQIVREQPTLEITEEEWRLRRKLINEEKEELFGAMRDRDIVGIADGIVDLMYVVLGTAVSYGIDADALFDLVHENNLTKFVLCPDCKGDPGYTVSIGGGAAGPCQFCLGNGMVAIKRADGKVLKSPDWKEPTPDIMREVLRQGYTGKWPKGRYDHINIETEEA